MIPRSNREPYPLKATSTDGEELKSRINALVDSVINLSARISFSENFNAYIAKDITISAGGTVSIEHSLGVIPKWRIILRQEGNGVISDVYSSWNTKTITLKNNGLETVTISVLIARE